MIRRKSYLPWIAALLLLSLGLAACGKSEQESEADWVTALEVNMSQFKKAQETGNQAIKDARTVPQLKAAYGDYVGLLEEVKSSLRGIEPPSQCEYAQEGVLDFFTAITSMTRELAAGEITQQAEAMQKQEAAKRKFKAALGPLFRESRC